MEKDFVCLLKEGEKKKYFDFIFKAIAIKQRCEDKELEMENVQVKMTSLKAKRPKMS